MECSLSRALFIRALGAFTLDQALLDDIADFLFHHGLIGQDNRRGPALGDGGIQLRHIGNIQVFLMLKAFYDVAGRENVERICVECSLSRALFI